MKNALLMSLALCYLSFMPAQAQKRKKSTAPIEVKSVVESEQLSGLSFRNVGPALTSGRISDIAVDPNDFNTFYVAAASGGVWKSKNHGITWKPIFDDQGSYSIGCLALDPQNSNVLWVGTGENNNQRSVAYGDGVYRSEDGGNTWEHMGLKESEHISKIIVHPHNSQHIYVASYGPLWSSGGERGIYHSEDGGTTWNLSLSVSEHTGFSDLIMDPRYPDILYAAAHQRQRKVWTQISGGPESAIYKSIDGGKNWDKLENGLPKGDVGRIGLSIAPSNPDMIYAIIEGNKEKGGVYLSEDRGASWSKQSDHFTSGNYYSEIFVDPVDDQKIFSMDTWLKVSLDGGKTFKNVGEKWKHVDNHAHWINPNNTDHMLSGCDGGLYETYNGGVDWFFYANLPITQFYKVSVDNDQPFYNIYGGTQDNFSLAGPSATQNIHGISNLDWVITKGGDGFESVADPTDANIVYAQSQYGWLARYDKKSGEIYGIKPIEKPDEEPYRWNWDAPLLISPHEHKRLYFAANKVFRSDDRGDSWQVISPDLTAQIDRNNLEVMGKVWSVDAIAKNKSTSIYGNLVALDESPLQEGLLYAGSDDGYIHISENAGNSWNKISNVPGVPANTYVNMLLTSKHAQGRVYAVFNNHKNGDFKPYVYVSEDKGSSWRSIGSNLPERGSVYAIAEDHVDEKLLFAGTEFGLFVSLDRGASWTQMKAGLPTIAVRDIDIQERESDLVLGTFGRGFYVLDNYAPLREVNTEMLAKEAHIFDVKEALMYVPARPLGLRGKSFQGASFYTAKNPDFGATFTYFLKEAPKTYKETRQEEEKDKLRVAYPNREALVKEDREEKPYLLFIVRDGQGNVVRRIQQEPKAGVNRVVWDFRYSVTVPVNLKSSTFDNPFSDPDVGPLAIPGTYSVSMALFEKGQFKELVSPKEFKITPLNNSTLPVGDREKTLAFQQKVAELQRIVWGTNNYVSELDKKLKHLVAAAKHTNNVRSDILVELNRVKESLEDVKVKLTGDKTMASREFPTSTAIASRVGICIYFFWETTAPPSASIKELYADAKSEFEAIYNDVKRIGTVTIPALEKQLDKAGAPHTPGRIPTWE